MHPFDGAYTLQGSATLGLEIINQINDMNTKQEEITKFNKEIISVKRKIKKIKPKYENYSTLFHSKAEVEGLYQNLSEFATLNGLVISVIEKGKPQQVSRSEILNKGKKKKKWGCFC